MMTAIHTALQAFWDGFSYEGAVIKAYENGNVPKNKDGILTVTYPFITYEVAGGAMFGTGFLTAFVWVKNVSGADSQAKRAAILDLIAAAIPDEGITLTLTGGHGSIALYRNDAGFTSYYDDPTDTSVLGGRVSVEAHYYTT